MTYCSNPTFYESTMQLTMLFSTMHIQQANAVALRVIRGCKVREVADSHILI